jgi:phosphoribosylanthranilate isomerase
MAGADAIGLVFYSSSKRAVGIAEANAITRVLPPFVTKVGLFVDATRTAIETILAEVQLDLLQFHGSEHQNQCLGYGLPFIKAIRMNKGVNLQEKAGEFDKADGLLLDTYEPGVAGGTGQAFNWALIGENIEKPLILAGGLNPGNVNEAIRHVRPYAVDVSSGVESGPGIKDHGKILQFVQQVRGSI